MEIQTKVKFQFEVSAREWALIINSLKKSGGNGIELAKELEIERVKHFREIERRFKTWLDSQEGISSNEKSSTGI